MLQRAENVSAHQVRGLIGMITDGRYIVVTIGRHPYRVPGRCSRQQFWAMVEQSETFPLCFIGVKERSYWRFDGRWFWDNEGLTADQVHALVVTRDQRRQATINRAQTMVAMEEMPVVPASRGLIPEDMKQLVWNRDQGRCRQCGSNTELQFDHIIPWSLGGATSPENLQGSVRAVQKTQRGVGRFRLPTVIGSCP